MHPYNSLNITGFIPRLRAAHKFTGKARDAETGYDYFGARYYSSELSVWLSVDPLADAAPGWTPYRYGLNNPINFTDPTGMLESTHTDEDGNVIAVYNAW
jgi:RHS repeat-associated protein